MTEEQKQKLASLQTAFIVLQAKMCQAGEATGGARPRERLEKSLDAGLRASEDQRMDVVGALVGIDRFEVAKDAHHVELVRDAVAPVHVARPTGDVERLAAIVAFQQ